MPANSVRELSDWIAIRELTVRYNRAWDDGDADAYAKTFTEDGVLDAGGMLLQGREQLATAVAGTPFGIVHLTTDAIVHIDGDRATQECSLIVCNRSEDRSPVTFTTTGRYRDTLKRTAQGWLFERRIATLDADMES